MYATTNYKLKLIFKVNLNTQSAQFVFVGRREIIMENVIKLKECQEVVKKLLNKSEVKVFDFQIIELTGDYPGFCADYCRLKISYEDVSR